MRRREFITLLGGAATWPVVARAQQPQKLPVVGFLYAGSRGRNASLMATFQRALAETGYVEDQNVMFQYRYAEGQYEQLTQLAVDLVLRQVTVIVATPNANAAYAAKAATSTIPIVFMVTDDPAKIGLVTSLSNPGGNATGVNYFIGELVAKRLEILRELLPNATRVGVLLNPNHAGADPLTKDIAVAASAVGLQIDVVRASDAEEIDAAFATLVRNGSDALLVAPDTVFVNHRVRIVSLAARYGFPSIYAVRQYVESGGLISYGTSTTDAYRQIGTYTGRILKGAKPAELPVMQPTKFELVLNLKTAKALGLKVPDKLLALADEVLE